MDADQGYPGFSGEPGSQEKEVILVQGIIDAYFEEKDGIVVLDYKTDKVKSAEQLKERIMHSWNIMHRHWRGFLKNR